MRTQDRIAIYLQVFFVSTIIPGVTLISNKVFGNDFNISLSIGVILAIGISLSILLLRLDREYR